MATVNVLMKMLDAPTGVGSADASGGKENGDEKTQKSLLKRVGDFAKKHTGIQFTTSALLKQSQVFTSTVGTIFQLIGALVDVILGPFIPIIVPLMMLIAKAIPKIQAISTWIADKLIGFIDWLATAWKDPAEAWRIMKENIPIWINSGIDYLWGFLSGSGPLGEIKRRVVQFAIMFPAFRNKIVGWALKLVPKIISGIGKTLAMLIKINFPILGKHFIDGLTWGKDKLMEAIKGLIKGLWGKLGEVIGKIPMMGKVGKALSGLGKGAKAVAMGSKAIPVLGAAATLGFGAYETYRAYQNYGWKGAAAYGAKTLAATGLTLTGNSVAGLAVDVGGSMALNKAFGGSALSMQIKVDKERDDGTRSSEELTRSANGDFVVDMGKVS